MGPIPVSNAAIARVAGHTRTLWLLPLFVPVLALLSSVAADEHPPQRNMSIFWAAFAVLCAAATLLAVVYRTQERGFLRELPQRLALPPGSNIGGLTSLAADAELVRYRVQFGLAVVSVSIHTPFREAQDPRSGRDRVIAGVLTGLLGWWSLSWGPIKALGALWNNLQGGERESAEQVVQRLTQQA